MAHDILMLFPLSEIYKEPGNKQPIPWENFKKQVEQRCPPSEIYELYYIDEENDWISLKNENDYQESLKVSRRGNSIHLRARKVKRAPVMSTEPTNATHGEAIRPKTADDENVYPQSSKPPDWFKTSIESLKVDLLACLSSTSKKDDNEESAPPILHPYVMCDNCSEPINGIRFKCGNCVDYDLCEKCEMSKERFIFHPPKHVFLKLYKPLLPEFSCFTEALIPCVLYNACEVKQHLSTPSSPATKREKKIKKLERKLENQKKKLQEQTEETEVSVARSCPVDFSIIMDLNAKILTDTIPQTIDLNTEFTMAWRVKNTGKEIWNSSTKLKCVNAGKHSVTNSEVDVPPLMPDENGFIFVKITTPNAGGPHFSTWQLCHDGVWFGPLLRCLTVSESSIIDGENGTVIESAKKGEISETATPVTSVSGQSHDLVSLSSSDSEEFVVVPLPECFKLNDIRRSTLVATEQPTENKPEELSSQTEKETPPESSSTSNEKQCQTDPVTGEPINPLNATCDFKRKPSVVIREVTPTQSLEALQDAVGPAQVLHKCTDNDTGEPSVVKVSDLPNENAKTSVQSSSEPVAHSEPLESNNHAGNEVPKATVGPSPFSAEHGNIMGQAIMNSAINVASVAYNSARKILNPDPPSESYPVQFQPPDHVKTPLPRSEQMRQGAQLMTAMDQLMDMGFGNRELNQRLLNDNNNNVEAVIVILLEDSDWHEQRH